MVYTASFSYNVAQAKNSPVQAKWIPQEASPLVDYLYSHRFERGNGGNFKNSTVSGAIKHLKQFHLWVGSQKISSVSDTSGGQYVSV